MYKNPLRSLMLNIAAFAAMDMMRASNGAISIPVPGGLDTADIGRRGRRSRGRPAPKGHRHNGGFNPIVKRRGKKHVVNRQKRAARSGR
jgi:hypothetical protein